MAALEGSSSSEVGSEQSVVTVKVSIGGGGGLGAKLWVSGVASSSEVSFAGTVPGTVSGRTRVLR